MPEGDSLVRLAQRLRPVVVHQTLSSSDFRLPSLATVSLAGARLTAVTTRGKYLLMHLADDAHRPGVLLSHLGMDGAWRLHHRGQNSGRVVGRGRGRAAGTAGGQVHVVLNSPTFHLVGVSLREVRLLSPEQLEAHLGFLGPDLLDPGWGAAHRQEALARFRAAGQTTGQATGQATGRAPGDLTIGAALLDQRLVAGIGNIYRCEVLLLAGLDPRTPVSDVDASSDLPGLLELARELMRANTGTQARSGRRAGAGTGSRTTTRVAPDASAPFGVRVLDPEDPAARRLAARGTPQYWVYGRERQGCLRCGGPVRRETAQTGQHRQAERVLYWCPRCQRTVQG